ncbi:uncharacterized protein LOC125193676 [Salvia hispanica]|uniref:uncharacterized protein LOC125193676 n=1 Tax=Salvia hispanica TaxID=49212 RepID=UPI002009CC65|nr:uncharacterized protein LOC125193676 [Salvia hispanica]
MPSLASNKERRNWTLTEEDALIAIVKTIAADWRQENAFRTGYLEAIEKQLKVWFPRTDLNTTNVQSKLTIWKRHYYLVKNMINTSGFGWNDSSNMITVENDVWKQYAKAHPQAKSMRFKSYRFYQEWVEIFGKDTAGGKSSQGTVDLAKVAKKQHASVDLAKVAIQEPYLPYFDASDFPPSFNANTQDDSFSNNNENISHEFPHSYVPLEEEVADTPSPGESNSINSTKRDGEKKTKSTRKRSQLESATSKDSVIVEYCSHSQLQSYSFVRYPDIDL